MAKIIWTNEAEWWLKEIYNFISEDNPTAAVETINGIYEKAQSLKEFPNIGYVYEHEKVEEIRILLYGHYRITYLINSDNDIVVLGIFHGSLTIDKYIKI